MTSSHSSWLTDHTYFHNPSSVLHQDTAKPPMNDKVQAGQDMPVQATWNLGMSLKMILLDTFTTIGRGTFFSY